MINVIRRAVKALGPSVVVAVVALGGGFALASHDTNTIHACANSATGALRMVDSEDECRASESPVEWTIDGPQGPAGPQGPVGPQGPTGANDEFVAMYGTGTNWADAGHGTECTLGEIILSAGAIANGVPANGQLLPINQNQALFFLFGRGTGGTARRRSRCRTFARRLRTTSPIPSAP